MRNGRACVGWGGVQVSRRRGRAGRNGWSVGGGAGVHEGAVAAHENDQAAAKVVGEDGHRDGGDDGPDDEGVPLPLPDVVEEAERVVAEVFELLAVHGELAGVEEVDAELDKGDEEQEVDGGDGVDADLGGDLVEAEAPGDEEDDEGGEAYGGVDSDDEAEGEAPGEAARGNASAEKAEEGAQDFVSEELAEVFGDGHREVGCGKGGC